jgi:hypothetical protein
MIRHPSKPWRGPYRHRRRGIVIFDRETEALIRRLAAATGEDLETAVLNAVNERHQSLDRLMRHRIEWSRQHRPKKPRPAQSKQEMFARG